MRETTNYLGARVDMAAAIKGADAEFLGCMWDRVQAALAVLPILTRCTDTEATERARLLGERTALLEARPSLVNR